MKKQARFQTFRDGEPMDKMNAADKRLKESTEKSMDILCRNKVAQARKEALSEAVAKIRNLPAKRYDKGYRMFYRWTREGIARELEDENE